MAMMGDAGGSEVWATGCDLNNVINIAGEVYACGIHDTLGLANGAMFTADSCYSEVSGSLPIMLDVNGAYSISFRHYGGGVRVKNLGSASPTPSPIQKMTMGVDHANVILDASCIGGEFILRGVGSWSNETGSPSPAVDISGFIEADDVRTTRKIVQNRTHTDPGTGIMTVFDDDNVSVYLQGDLFEDVAATQPYRGQGADRRDRLT